MAVFIHHILFKLTLVALQKNMINVIGLSQKSCSMYMTVLDILFNETS